MQELKRIYWTRRALRWSYRAVILWLGISVALSFIPKTNVIARPGVSGVGDIFRGMLDAALAAAALPGTFLVVLVIIAVVIHSQDVRRRDPVRRFSRQHRREGLARAGGQCEMEAGFRRRCSRPAEHGDHFFPWSKGGASSLQNFVAACARCNRTKGARLPSPGQQARMERRRRAYFTPDGSVSVGERLPLR
jgi:hypothetical protein